MSKENNTEIHEIRVLPQGHDPAGQDVLSEIRRSIGADSIEDIKTAKVYRFQGITGDDAHKLANSILTDPISERYTIDRPADFGAPHTIEIAYKPAVMNPEAESLIKAALDSNITPDAADSSVEYAFFGDIDQDEIDRVVGSLLVNETTQRVVAEKPRSLTTEGKAGPIEIVPIIEATDEQLEALSKDKLFLSQEEMRSIQDHFKCLGREPTDCELEIIAGAWSEHCGHKTFNSDIELLDGTKKPSLFSRIADTSKRHFKDKVLSAFHDNAGVMGFYDGQAICGKVETHNSPSALEPYGGAETGSGGVFRDILGTGQGAKNIISTNMFCLASPDIDEAKLPAGTLKPDYLQRRLVHGVRDYGNRTGIPTANGSLHFHEDFRAKPTVIVGAYGIMPEEYAYKGEPRIKDQVFVLGGRTGRDGIHGATFSSGEMTDRTAEVNSSAVQIGNAIEEKRTMDAILEARDKGCIRAITDCGAAGFSSAIGEMGEEIGVTVDISRAPLKYEGLAPWEIFLSESQERMVLAVPPAQATHLTEICAKYNVEATCLGEFDGSHTLTVNYGDKNVAELDYNFIKNGLPERIMKADWQPQTMEEIKPNSPESSQEWADRLLGVMAHGNVCSKQPIVQQYDHGVQAGNIVSPFGGKTEEGPNDALVIRPLLDKPYGLVQSHGMNPILNRIDPYEGSKWAIAEAMANYVAVGGNPSESALINNFIWPYPEKEEMGSLDRSVDAITEMMDKLEIPVISGKDSLSSTYRGKNGEVIKIPPVLCISAFGKIPDIEKTVTADIKKIGSTLIRVGKQSKGMGCSAYYDTAGGQSSKIPKIDTGGLKQTLQTIHKVIESGKVLSCHDISEGGLAAAVTEMSIGGQCGVSINVPLGSSPEHFLFNETAGTFVIEVENPEDIVGLLVDSSVEFEAIGRTTSEATLKVNNGELFTVDIDELKKAWQQPTKELF